MDHGERVAVLGAHERQHFIEYIALVLIVAVKPTARVCPTGIPAFGINTVQADQLHPALLDMVRQRADHATIFVFKKTALRCWKYYHWSAGVAEHQQFHGTVERGAIPAMIRAVHACALSMLLLLQLGLKYDT